MAKKQPIQGDGLARAIATVVTDAMVKVRAGLLPHEQAHKWQATTAWMESLEGEMSPSMGPLASRLLEHPDLPDEYRPILTEMANPDHQIGLFYQVLGAMGAMLAVMPQIGSVLIRDMVAAENQAHRNIPMTPADAASGVARGIVDYTAGDNAAGWYGFDPIAFQDLVALAGEPPGPVDMLSLWRRGLVDQGFIERAVRYSRIHNDYIPAVLELAHSYMTPADVVELAIKGLVTPSTGAEMFGVAGGIPDQFEILFQGAGNAIGNEQVLELYNQGLATEADVTQVFGRSRMNPIFYPLAFQLRHKFLGVHQIMQVLEKGGVTDAVATEWLAHLGYNAEQSAGVVAAGTTTKAAKVKAETEAMVVELYAEKVINRTEAEAQLVGLGYHADVAAMILDLADAKVARSQQNQAISGIRSAMVAGRITPTKASADLDALGVPSAARDQWLKAWEIEQGTKVKSLTTAQVGSMAKKKIVSYEAAMKYWGEEGYSAIETQLLAAEYGGGPLVDASGNVNTFTGSIHG